MARFIVGLLKRTSYIGKEGPNIKKSRSNHRSQKDKKRGGEKGERRARRTIETAGEDGE